MNHMLAKYVMARKLVILLQYEYGKEVPIDPDLLTPEAAEKYIDRD